MQFESYLDNLEGPGTYDNALKQAQAQRRTQLAINGLAASGDLLIQTLTTSRTAFDANIALQVEAAKKFTVVIKKYASNSQ